MADYRQIHTKIWCDEWFLELCPQGKLLFIYLFSNKRTCLAGIYDIPLKLIAFETELLQERIQELLAEFADAKKAYYEDGYIWIPSMPIHNTNNLASPKVQANIFNTYDALPYMPLKVRWAQHWNGIIAPRYGIHTVSIPYLQNKTEHIQNTDLQEQGADAPSPTGEPSEKQVELPATFQEWQALIKEPPPGSNRIAVLRRMCEVQYPGLDPPDYGRIGKTARKVGGAGRLADLIWKHSTRPPTGDLMSYLEGVARNGYSNRSNGHENKAEYRDDGDNPLGVEIPDDPEPAIIDTG